MAVTFEDVQVPAVGLLGKESHRQALALAALDSGCVAVGAQAVGVA